MSKMFKWGLGREGSLAFASHHTAKATLQPHNICLEDSHSPHRSQLSSCPIPFALIWSFVSKMFLAALHMKCLTLLGQFKFQIIFQIAFILDPSENPPFSPCWFLFSPYFCATLYALLTLNFPLGVQAQIKESSRRRELIRIPKITSVREKGRYSLPLPHSILSSPNLWDLRPSPLPCVIPSNLPL